MRAEGFDALLPFLLDLLFHHTPHLRFVALAGKHRIARSLELSLDLVKLLLQLEGHPITFLDLGGSSLLNRHGLARLPDDGPVMPPVLVRRDQFRLRQASPRLFQKIRLPTLLRPLAVPRQPAHGELLVHEALEANLTEVRHTLVLFRFKIGL